MKDGWFSRSQSCDPDMLAIVLLGRLVRMSSSVQSIYILF
jgi:hypothetical protein